MNGIFCPSVTPFWLCSHHRIIIKFSGVITNDQSKVHATGQGQRSKVKLTEVTTQLNRFRTVTPVWIDIWWWNDAYSLMLLRRGALLFFKVICQISRSHGSENHWIRLKLDVSWLWLKFEFTNGYEMMHKAWSSIKRCPIVFQGHTSNCKVTRLIEFTNGYEMMHQAWSSIEEVPYCFSRSSVKFEGHMALKIV